MNEIQDAQERDLSTGSGSREEQQQDKLIAAGRGAETRPILCKECGAELTNVRNCKSMRAGLCRGCFRRAYDRAYRQSHKDRYRLYARRYYEAHGQQLRNRNTERKRGWRENHRAHYQTYQREYKRRIRGTSVEGAQQELPDQCIVCGVDISQKWATKARRAGFCSTCHERLTRSRQYRRSKAREDNLSEGAQGLETQTVANLG